MWANAQRNVILAVESSELSICIFSCLECIS